MELITMIGDYEYARTGIADFDGYPLQTKLALRSAVIEHKLNEAKRKLRGTRVKDIWFVLSAESKMNQVKI